MLAVLIVGCILLYLAMGVGVAGLWGRYALPVQHWCSRVIDRCDGIAGAGLPADDFVGDDTLALVAVGWPVAVLVALYAALLWVFVMVAGLFVYTCLGMLALVGFVAGRVAGRGDA